jgi:hypothetical protein
MSATGNKAATIYALLKEGRTALKLWKEASQEGTSSDPTVRAIIDRGLGFIALGTLHPADDTQERIIRIETQSLDIAESTLLTVPGVQAVSRTFRALTA